MTNLAQLHAQEEGLAGLPPGAAHDKSEATVSLPFSERLALVVAQAEELEAHTRKRVDLRAEEGRDLSESTRAGLVALAKSLNELAGIQASDDDNMQEEATE